MRLLETVRRKFDEALQPLSSDRSELLSRITATRDAQFGDYQANLALAMILGKQLGCDPVGVAGSLAEQLKSTPIFDSVEVAGKGYINIRLSDKQVIDWLLETAGNSELAISRPEKPKVFVVDFSGPNVAKPMHVGHIRSTVIGDAIVRILRFLGHHVVSDNHLGDWGTQFGMVIYGYKHFSDSKAFQENPVTELSRVYRLIQQIISYQDAKRSLDGHLRKIELLRNQLIETQEAIHKLPPKSPDEKKFAKQLKSLERGVSEANEETDSLKGKIADVESKPELVAINVAHPNIEPSVLNETAKLHSGDEENLRLWHEFLPHCKAEIQRIYDMLDIRFDHELGESFYHQMLGPTVEALLRHGTAVESQGAVCVFLDGFEAPMIIRKQDGAFLYATTDLATVEYRMKTFHPDAILYVVDHRQSDHFKKLFACLRKTGLTNVELKHVTFGTVLGKDGRPFKTRSGTVVGLESLLDDAKARAWNVVGDPDRLKNASLDFSEDEKLRIATAVGIGAIKYADLSHHRENDYEFDPDKMVQLEGNTAAYIQYSYARTQNILRKLSEKAEGIALDAPIQKQHLGFVHPLERSLAIQLLRFEDSLQMSMQDYLPSIVTEYLYELAKLFASFFDQCQVLRAESETERETRRLLVQLTGRTLKQGLELLNIQTVDRM
jgi:arginyl-tRNA synthetase